MKKFLASADLQGFSFWKGVFIKFTPTQPDSIRIKNLLLNELGQEENIALTKSRRL